MVRNRNEVVEVAQTSKTNVPGTRQLWVRTQYQAPSVGDVDGDGDADAVDGWLKEPVSARHYGDRNPPKGVPVAFSGGSKGYGHRAISLGGGKVRSTDMSDDGLRYEPGNVGNTTIANIERSMNQTYLGWSTTISGLVIPVPGPHKPAKPPKPKNNNVTRARDLLVKAERYARRKGKVKRANRIAKMLKVGPKD